MNSREHSAKFNNQILTLYLHRLWRTCSGHWSMGGEYRRGQVPLAAVGARHAASDCSCRLYIHYVSMYLNICTYVPGESEYLYHKSYPAKNDNCALVYVQNVHFSPTFLPLLVMPTLTLLCSSP